jgi:RNA polymerase sigma factor (sigma-70 family)
VFLAHSIALLSTRRSVSSSAPKMTSDPRQVFLKAIERTHGRQLRRFLSARMRGAAADVPDLAQEIFLRLLRIKDHDAIRNPQAYLFTVASHVLSQYNLTKLVASKKMAPLQIVSELQAEATAPDPADEIEAEERLKGVSAALEHHSSRAYATLVMYRCEGLTLKQIGERLGVTPTMARKYLLRAIAFCDEQLEDKEDFG